MHLMTHNSVGVSSKNCYCLMGFHLYSHRSQVLFNSKPARTSDVQNMGILGTNFHQPKDEGGSWHSLKFIWEMLKVMWRERLV